MLISDFSTSDVIEVEDVVARQRIDAADRFGRREIEAAREYCDAREQDLLVVLQQVVRPVDERAQRLLARLQRSVAASQQLVAILQPLVDVGDGSASARAPPRAPAPAECPRAATPARRPPALRARSARSSACAASPARRRAGPQCDSDSASKPAALRRQRQRLHDDTSARPERAARCGSSSGCGHPARRAGSRSTSSALASMICSQLSRISSSLRDFRCAHSVCISGRPGLFAHAEHARRLARDERTDRGSSAGR